MAKKIILQIAFKHGAEDNRIYRRQCISLAQNPDYDVTYITSDINANKAYDIENNVKRVIIPAYPRRVIRQFVHLSRVKKMVKMYDHVDVVELHETMLLLIALWMKRRGIKVIFNSHEDYFQQLKMRFGGAVAHIYKAYEKFVCRRIDAVIFPCKMVDREVFDYEVKRLVYLDNYPVLQEKQISYAEKKEFLACYMGAISYERGVVNAIKAWDKAHIRGILGGSFGSPDAEKMITNMKEYRYVDYRGWCGPEEVDQVYRESSVGMATLLDRGQYHKSCNLPTKVCEYMMYGIPAIIYTTPYVESVMDEYEFGIMVDPENVDEIANAICTLKNNPDMVKHMGEEGQRAVRERFNWGAEEKKLFALYEDLLADGTES